MPLCTGGLAIYNQLLTFHLTTQILMPNDRVTQLAENDLIPKNKHNTNNEPIRAQPAIWQPRDMLETTWYAASTSSLEHEKQSRKKRGSAAWQRTSFTDIATRSIPTESYQRTACDIYHMLTQNAIQYRTHQI